MDSGMSKLEACTILNIDENAPMEEVKRAYKDMALRHHPDKNQGNPEANKNFGKIKKAYKYLVELDKIRLPQQTNNEHAREASNQPLPNEFQLWFTLEEMYNGCVREEKISRKVLNQSGEEESEEIVLQVKIAPETLPTARITIEQAGDRITGNIPANVVFIVNELPHENFKRSRFDLEYIAKITVEQTCILDSLLIPTLSNNADPIEVKIDYIITKDKTINIPGHGFVIPKSGKRGNLIVKFEIIYPTLPQDPPVEYFVDVSLEQILNGCTEKLTIARHIVEHDDPERVEDYECIVEVPPGTETGKRHTFHQKGDKYPDRIPADFIIIVRVKPHVFFKRNEVDIVHTICLTLSETRKGGLSFEVPTLSGIDELLQLDEPIAFGTTKKYLGYGLPHVEQPENRGDLIVRFDILNDTRIGETVKYDLKLTLENILSGYDKVLRITRKIYDDDKNEFELKKVITIHIEPGAKIGQTYTFPRIGNKHAGFMPGDVQFVVGEKPHKFFKRINDVDLEYVALIKQNVFATGGQITIPTLDNKEISLCVGQIFDPSIARKSFSGYGLPHFCEKDKRGDLLVRFELVRT